MTDEKLLELTRQIGQLEGENKVLREELEKNRTVQYVPYYPSYPALAPCTPPYNPITDPTITW